ncbi:MAG: hypothetical protein PHS46_07380 [Candidatus Omnitrophica bacterium]|nr:hypothetical protein [Candidatus Omnitrophota bacterium]
MKKWLVMFFAIIFIANITGCDAVQRKFTRKNKTVKKPRFYQLKKYTKKPPPELYKQHYSYWASWQEEMVKVVGQNIKKDQRCAAEAIGHLKDMQALLVEEKADELEAHIESMESLKAIIARGSLSSAGKDYVRNSLDREDRIIKRDFCYSKVKKFIRMETEEPSGAKLSMAVGKEIKPLESEK